MTIATEQRAGEVASGFFEVGDAVVGITQEISRLVGKRGISVLDLADFQVHGIVKGHPVCDGGLDGHVGTLHWVVEPLKIVVLPALGRVLHRHLPGHVQAPWGCRRRDWSGAWSTRQNFIRER